MNSAMKKHIYTIFLSLNVLWGCWAQSTATESAEVPLSLYQKLLQYRIQHNSTYQQLQMQADIAANKAEKAKSEALTVLEVGSGDTQLALNSNTAKPEIKTSPYASVSLPSYNNTGIKISVPYSKTGITMNTPGRSGITQTQNLGADIRVSTDIYSKNAENRKYTLNLVQSAADTARQSANEGAALVEKRFLQDIQDLSDTYMVILDKELQEVKAEIQYHQMQAQGYAEDSTKMRTARLELLGASREHRNADFSFSSTYHIFMESCGITENTVPHTFLIELWNSIPMQDAAGIDRYDQSAYKPLAEAEQLYEQNTVKRDISLSPFSIGAEAGYRLHNTQTTFGSVTTKELTHTMSGGLNMQFPGGKLYTGVEVPLATPKNTAIHLAFSWNPFALKYRKLEKQNAALEAAIERLKIEDAKKQYQKQVQTNKTTEEQIVWQQNTTADELSIYKQNAEDHAQWYRAGIISKVESLQAELEYKKAEVRAAKAKTAVIIFNIDTALLFKQ